MDADQTSDVDLHPDADGHEYTGADGDGDPVMGRQEVVMSRHLRPTRSDRFAREAFACGLLLVLAGGPAAWAQTFPSTVPNPVMVDDFETTTPPRPPDDPLDGSGAIWDEWTPSGSQADFTYYTGTLPGQVVGGVWGDRCMVEDNVRRDGGYLVARQSMPGNPLYDPWEWTNIRVDVDVNVDQNGIPGIVWGAHDPDNDGIPDDGYLLTIEGFPTLPDALNNGDRAIWKVSRINGEGSSTIVDLGTVDLPASDDYTKYMVYYRAFRLRLEWYCGNLRVRVQRIYNPGPGVSPPEFYGCGGSCPSNDPEACWCTARRVERQRLQPDPRHHRSLSQWAQPPIGPERDSMGQLPCVGVGPSLQCGLRSLEPVDPDLERNDPLQAAV